MNNLSFYPSMMFIFIICTDGDLPEILLAVILHTRQYNKNKTTGLQQHTFNWQVNTILTNLVSDIDYSIYSMYVEDLFTILNY